MRGLSLYMGRRLVASAVTLLGVSFIVVALVRLLPGDPARVIAGLQASEQEVDRIRRRDVDDLSDVTGGIDAITARVEQDAHGIAYLGVVFGDQHVGQRHEVRASRREC